MEIRTQDRSPAADREARTTLERLWLNYFNEVLFQKGMITEEERNRMCRAIRRRGKEQYGE